MLANVFSWFHLLPRWVIGSAVFALILFAAHLLQMVVVWALGRRSARWSPIWQHMFRDTEHVARFAFVLLAATVALPLIPIPHDIDDVIRKVLAAAVIVLIGWIVMIAGNIAIERYTGQYQLDLADNLLARKAVTQARIFKRALNVAIVMITAALALMTFDSVRQFGVSLFASAGVAGIVVGLAAQPLLGNLLAGMQIAVTQPIRIQDAVLVEGEFGWVEEITSTYVVIRIWDLRRMVVPISYFLQKPFQNWTRSGANLLGHVMLYFDYSVPVERLRAKAKEILQSSKLWDGQVFALQVTDATDRSVEIRVLYGARNAGDSFDLGVLLRERLIAFVQEEFPRALPRARYDAHAVAAITSQAEKNAA